MHVLYAILYSKNGAVVVYYAFAKENVQNGRIQIEWHLIKDPFSIIAFGKWDFFRAGFFFSASQLNQPHLLRNCVCAMFMHVVSDAIM